MFRKFFSFLNIAICHFAHFVTPLSHTHTREKTHDFRCSFYISVMSPQQVPTNSEGKGACSQDCATETSLMQATINNVR
jgi:hypothetical protein